MKSVKSCLFTGTFIKQAKEKTAEGGSFQEIVRLLGISLLVSFRTALIEPTVLCRLRLTPPRERSAAPDPLRVRILRRAYVKHPSKGIVL